MKPITAPVLAAVLLMAVAAAPAANAQETMTPVHGDTALMTAQARGTFEVTLTRQPSDDFADGEIMGRMTIDKRFLGDLEGTSRGQMLTGMTAVRNSAGYVAIERVTGSLGGRNGSFLLQHSGTMTRGTPGLVVTVVPDSGTDDLTGISGTMLIDVSGGRHSYVFDYALPSSPDER